MKNLLLALLFLSLCAACNKPLSNRIDRTVTVDESGDVRLSAEDIQAQIDAAKNGASLKFKAGTYWGTLLIQDRKNLTLDFTGVKLLTKKDQTIFWINKCSNIAIKGLTLYHDVGEVGCFTNCFDVDHSESISFETCDINGSGFIGVCVNQSMAVQIKNCTIHKCEFGVFVWENNETLNGATAKTSKVIVEACTFENNAVGHVCFDHNYAKASSFEISINNKKHEITKENYIQYEKSSSNFVVH